MGICLPLLRNWASFAGEKEIPEVLDVVITLAVGAVS